MKPILDIARDLDLTPAQITPYGHDKAKIPLAGQARAWRSPRPAHGPYLW